MEQNVFDVLKERGFIEQTTHEAEIRELLGKEKVTFYIGFDATADSLTAGHFLTIMAMMHMQTGCWIGILHNSDPAASLHCLTDRPAWRRNHNDR